MQKINFQDLPDTTTPADADNLNLLQDNVENDLGLLSNLTTTSKTNLVSAINETKSNTDNLLVDEYSTSNSVGYTANFINELVADKVSDVYSTSEVKTNKVWIDGKPIYRKCFYVSSFPNNSSIWVATGISNIEQVTYTGGYGQNTNEMVVINSAYNTSYIDSLTYERAGTNAGKLRVHTISDRSAYSGYIWIEYTKTTD